MARQGISTGLSANDGLGDNLRAAGGKINDNFSEIYSYFGDGDDLTVTIGTGIATAGGSVGTGVTILDFRGSALSEVVVGSGIATITVSDFQQTYTDADVNTHLNISSAGTNQVLGWNGSDYTWVAQTSGYGDSNVDTHLNQSNPTSGYVLSWNGSDYAWVSNAGYTDTNVDTHLNQSNPTAGYVLSWDGSDYAWISNAGYTDASVDAHLNQSNPTAGYVLSWDGSDYAWTVGVTTENVVTDSLVVSGISTLTGDLSVSGVSTFAIGGGSTVFFGGESGAGSLAISHSAGNNYGVLMQFTSHDGDVASIETDSNSNMIITGGANINLRSDPSHTVLSSGGNATQIYYDNDLKFATSNEGVSITGDAQLSGSVLSSYTGSTETFAVTVSARTTSHRYGTGGNGYFIDGVEAPFLTLTPGKTYRFNLSASDQSNHPFRFYLEADKTTQYTTNVTTAATYTEIVVTDETPTVLHYQCDTHPNMGNAVQVNSNVVNTPYQIDGLSGANITGVITATTANITGNMTVGGVLTYEDVTNVDSVGLITARSGIDVTSSGVYVSSGIVTATDFNSTSDETLKENITTVENAVDLNTQLRGVRFEWKKDGKPSYGVIAQELEQVLPELVSGTDPKTVNYNGIIGVLIEAVKELSARVEELENK